MEVDVKLKEMEDEIKVLKAEIRNVLLDIREVILERTNPLDDGHDAAVIRMDLRTTTSALAAEAAAHEARNAMDAADAASNNGHADHTHPAPAAPPIVLGEPDDDVAPIDTATDEPEDEPPPKVIRRDPRELKMLAEEKENNPPEIPPAYRADPSQPSYRVEFAPIGAPLSGNGSLSGWLSYALNTVGPQELSRIIAVHRSWGNLPPNLSRALAYVQEMLEQTEETDPAWLRVMRQLDELASL
jgi:hypothetical protein